MPVDTSSGAQSTAVTFGECAGPNGLADGEADGVALAEGKAELEAVWLGVPVTDGVPETLALGATGWRGVNR